MRLLSKLVCACLALSSGCHTLTAPGLAGPAPVRPGIPQSPGEPSGALDSDESARWRGQINYVLGARRSGTDLGDARNALVPIGFDLAVQPPSSQVALVVQMLAAVVSDGPDEAPSSSILDVDSITSTQANLGLRWTFARRGLRPFFGGGLSYLDMAFNDSSALFGANGPLGRDQSVGLWFGGGAYADLGRAFTLGFTLQQTFGHEIVAVGRTFDADALDLLVFLGFRY